MRWGGLRCYGGGCQSGSVSLGLGSRSGTHADQRRTTNSMRTPGNAASIGLIERPSHIQVADNGSIRDKTPTRSANDALDELATVACVGCDVIARIGDREIQDCLELGSPECIMPSATVTPPPCLTSRRQRTARRNGSRKSFSMLRFSAILCAACAQHLIVMSEPRSRLLHVPLPSHCKALHTHCGHWADTKPSCSWITYATDMLTESIDDSCSQEGSIDGGNEQT